MDSLFDRLQTALGDAYRLQRELGGGGMSRLFLATEASLDRQVVVKVLPPELASEVSAARFTQEIRLAAHLQHPNILPVLAAEARGDLLYYIMPYVAGESLRHRLTREGKLPVADALRILDEIADALSLAHSEGVIHRDIKPENILLQGGHAVLADFGVARALVAAQSGGRLTETGMAVGTPSYMSPEQAGGERNIDARADVYALAVTGYEMLAGEPPFGGPTAQAVIAAMLTEPARPVTALRPEAPPTVAAALMRALAKDPNERLRTAAELRDACRAARPGVGRPAAAGRVVWLGGLGVGVAAAAVAGVLLLKGGESASLDPNMVAVAPFDVLDPKLQLWHEGLVDVLSRNLDGAGPLKTISPTLVVRRFSGRADPASAAALGRSTGAGLVVFGQLVASAGDSVRATATLLESATGHTIGEIEIRDVSESMDRVSDSLTVGLLRQLGQTRPIGAVRLTSMGSTSLPALKEFLQGEQFYRRTAWDSAIAHYDRALALDRGFALAYLRLGNAVGWQRNGGDSLSLVYMLRAGELNHDLPPRDSLLALVDSLEGVLYEYRMDHGWWSLARRLFATLDHGTARYPNDPEMWYALGDARHHFGFGPAIGGSNERELEAFDRSIALDSAFAPSYIHPVEIALSAGNLTSARRYAARYRALAPTDVEGSGIELAVALLDPARAGSPEVARMLDTASADLLTNARSVVRFWPDSAETALRLSRALVGRRGSYRQFTDSNFVKLRLAQELTYRGHLAEAYRLLGRRDPQLFAQLALLDAVPRDTAAAVFAGWLGRGSSQAAGALPWWANQRDTASLVRFARRAAEEARTAAGPALRDFARYLTESATAYLALARGDTSAAARAFDQLPDTLCVWCYTIDRVQRAQLIAAGYPSRDTEALLNDKIVYQNSTAFAIVGLARARDAERRGDRDQAIKSFAYVADVWAGADPQLQPFVAEARSALQRLSGEPRR